ncbi:MAG: HAD hydrolase-like protein [Oscillospiraceae bacterium]|nr:HAD hydrolase-like protein [Oscillospiraceae bacterium]
MSDKDLREIYVPDVYQKDVYAIDYKQLKTAGIRFISFDIDDTIAKMEEYKPPKNTIILFERLKQMGFCLALLTNNVNESRAERFSEKLGVDYIAHAHKPRSISFEEFQNRYFRNCHAELAKKQMAHVGNNLIHDVGGGNVFGITTCLVRRSGTLAKPFHVNDECHKLRKVLKERGIWRKHHLYVRHDQYYQLQDTPDSQKL